MTLVDDRTASTVLPNGLTLADARAQAARAHELDRAHVFHSWSAQAELNPMTIVASQGSYVWDGEGNRLLDCYLANVGPVNRNVQIVVLNAKGKAVVGPVAVTLAPGEEKVARADANKLGRYCKFIVPAPKSDFRASVLVFQEGVGATSALAAN